MTRRIYTEGGPASFYLDLCRTQLPEGVLSNGVVKKAEARLHAHAEETREEILNGSTEGRAALQQFRDSVRTADYNENRRAIEDIERRAISQTILSEFSTPQYILSEWAPFRAPLSPFADAARQLVLPDVGYQLHIPGFTSGTTTDVDDLELVGLPQSSPSTNYITDPIQITQAKGAVTVSQQLLDRGGAPDGQGGAFDLILAQQLHEQLRASMDSYVITTALAGAQTVTEGTTLTVPLFWTNLTTQSNCLPTTRVLLCSRLTSSAPVTSLAGSAARWTQRIVRSSCQTSALSCRLLPQLSRSRRPVGRASTSREVAAATTWTTTCPPVARRHGLRSLSVTCPASSCGRLRSR